MEPINVKHKKEEKKIPNLRFPEFEGEWSVIRLGDETKKIGSGVTPRGGSKVYKDKGVLFIRSQNVNHDRLNLDDVTYITEEIHEHMRGSEVHPSDILLNITGASIGRSCVVSHDFKIGNVNQHVCIIRLINDQLPKFYQAFLSSSKGQKLVYQGQAGGGREGLNFQSIRFFKIAIPTLPEQQKIASFLSAVDQKIQQLTRKKELLEQYKKGVMQKIFSQEIRFKPALTEASEADSADFDYAQSAGNRLEIDKSGVVERSRNYPDWEEKRLGELCEMTSSKRVYLSDYVNRGIPFYRGKEISELKKNQVPSDLLYITEERYKDFKLKYGVPVKGDILITAVGTLGNIFRIRNNNKFYFKDGNLIWLRNITENSEFLEFYIQYNVNELIKTSIGSTQKALTIVELKKIKLLIPSLEEQQKIASFLTSIDKKTEMVQTQINQTQQFKKGLLQQLFV